MDLDYPMTYETEAGRRRRYRTATCKGCQTVGRWSDNRIAMAPPELVSAGFRKMGWQIHGRGLLCPDCVRATKQARAFRAEPPDHTTDKPKEEPPEMAADQPRAASREDRRRIMEALDANYQTQAGCYSAGFSDQKLAELLNVPRAWVSEERDRYFGPEVNEAQRREEKYLADLGDRCTKAIEDAMSAAAKLEAIQNEIQAYRVRKAA